MNQNSNSSPFAGIVLPEGANVSFNNISGDYIAGNVYHNTISGDAYFDGKKEAEAEEEKGHEEVPNDDSLRIGEDELLLLIRDKTLYEEVVYWASTCKKAKDIRNRIVEPLRRKGFKYFDKNFVIGLLPFLENYEGSKNLDTLTKQIY